MSEFDVRSRLSASGKKRRDEMLGELTGAMRAHHARKRARRRAAVVGAIGLALIGAGVLVLPRQSAPPPEMRAETPPPPQWTPEPQRVIVHTEIVATDSNAAERYIVRTRPHRGILLSDEELIDALGAIGRPTGLVRMEGRAWVTAAVTDDELRKRRDPPRGL